MVVGVELVVGVVLIVGGVELVVVGVVVSIGVGSTAPPTAPVTVAKGENNYQPLKWSTKIRTYNICSTYDVINICR